MQAEDQSAVRAGQQHQPPANSIVRLGSGGLSSEGDIRKVMTQLSRCGADLQAAAAATAAAWSHANLAPEWHTVYLRIAQAQEEIQHASRAIAKAMSRVDGCDRRRSDSSQQGAAAQQQQVLGDGAAIAPQQPCA